MNGNREAAARSAPRRKDISPAHPRPAITPDHALPVATHRAGPTMWGYHPIPRCIAAHQPTCAQLCPCSRIVVLVVRGRSNNPPQCCPYAGNLLTTVAHIRTLPCQIMPVHPRSCPSTRDHGHCGLWDMYPTHTVGPFFGGRSSGAALKLWESQGP